MFADDYVCYYDEKDGYSYGIWEWYNSAKTSKKKELINKLSNDLYLASPCEVNESGNRKKFVYQNCLGTLREIINSKLYYEENFTEKV